MKIIIFWNVAKYRYIELTDISEVHFAVTIGAEINFNGATLQKTVIFELYISRGQHSFRYFTHDLISETLQTLKDFINLRLQHLTAVANGHRLLVSYWPLADVFL